MRNTGREQWKRIASIVLVTVIAALSLPVGASALTRAVDATPAQRAHIKRLEVDARPIVNRRSLTQHELTLTAASFLVVALTLLGVLSLARPIAPGRTPGPRPVQRGPPSYALNPPVLR